jgi:phage gpG-like protein
MIQMRVTVRDLAIKRKFRRAIKQFSSFQDELAKVGDWLIDDARKRLAARNSKWGRGRLARSLRRVAHRFVVTIYSHLPYARIQQEGGVVKSRRAGGMLAIPLREKEGRSHTWPRMWKTGRLFLVKSERGRLFLACEGSGGKVQFVYLLVRKVTIPARPYLVKSPQLVRCMRTLIVQKWERWKRGAA